MRIYHGTPCGGSRQDVVRFLRGRCALGPFPRPDDLGAVAEVFPLLAFGGLKPEIVLTMFAAKVAGGAAWAWWLRSRIAA